MPRSHREPCLYLYILLQVSEAVVIKSLHALPRVSEAANTMQNMCCPTTYNRVTKNEIQVIISSYRIAYIYIYIIIYKRTLVIVTTMSTGTESVV